MLKKVFSICIAMVFSIPLQASMIAPKDKVLRLSGNHLDPQLMQHLVTLFDVDVLFETGTFVGDTAENAASFFREVHTVELGKDLYKNSKNRLSKYANVHCHQGHSGEVIANVLPTIKGKILFWLDAHWSGGITAKGDRNTAVWDELAAIKKCGIKDAVILIDDIREFHGWSENNPKAGTGGYPDIWELQQMIQEINPSYQFCVLGDIAIAFPKEHKILTSPYVEGCTKSRMFKVQNGSYTEAKEVIAAEKILYEMPTESETRAIIQITNAFVKNDSLPLTTHYLLWRGLLHLGNRNIHRSVQIFKKLLTTDAAHWRIVWYWAKAEEMRGNQELAMKLTRRVLERAPDFEEAYEFLEKLERNGVEPMTSTMPLLRSTN